MKFYCVKDRCAVEVPDADVKPYVPTDPAKLEKFKKAGRVGFTATHSCGTKMYTFRSSKKAEVPKA